ncbi:MAG: flavin monoamine oxidase family protein [Betaproteobacteria bacterium]
MVRSSGRQVIVIGAGMAGLTALDRLSHAGFHVTVLESRARAGGRIRTVREQFADGLYADVGATYVVDCHARLLAYVDELDLPLQIVNPRHLPSLFHLRGRNVRFAETGTVNVPLPLTAAERKLGFAGMFETYLAPAVNAVGQPALTRWPDAKGASFDRLNGRQMLEQAGASPAAIELLGVSLLGLYGEGLDSTSALFLATQQKLTEFTTTYTIRGGMDRLPTTLAARYHDRITYGHEVTDIRHTARGVRVAVRGPGGAGSLEADFAIVTVPYAALRRIRITPALSRGKRRVVDDLPNTSVVRGFVQCRERFWDRIDGSGTVFTDIPGMAVFSGYSRPSRRGILEAYFSGAAARRLSGMPEARRARRIVELMTRIFRQIPEYVESVVTQCWDSDPWARGAYAWYAPGQLVSFLPDLARPDGRLHFAGDHTSLLPGWIEGAIASGERAAGEIMERA